MEEDGRRIPFRAWLGIAFCALFAVSLYRAAGTTLDQVLHHLPVVALVIWLVARGRHHPMSNLSYIFILIFLCLHLFGAHYLYSNVPYDRWSENIFGVTISETFGFERNHYDRLVHFFFGVCFVLPLRELTARSIRPRGAWLHILPVILIIACSTIYELAEWGLATIVSPETAEKYNGQQGDIWDPHWDTLLATVGAILTAVILGLVRGRGPR